MAMDDVVEWTLSGKNSEGDRELEGKWPDGDVHLNTWLNDDDIVKIAKLFCDALLPAESPEPSPEPLPVPQTHVWQVGDYVCISPNCPAASGRYAHPLDSIGRIAIVYSGTSLYDVEVHWPVLVPVPDHAADYPQTSTAYQWGYNSDWLVLVGRNKE